LALNTMLWPDEIRAASFDFLSDDITVRPQELQMAASLIESMAGDFKPDEFTDEYRDALQKVIEAKGSGQEIVAPPAVEEAPSGAIDLMAALRASVDRARAARESGRSGDEHEPVAPTPITAATSAKSTPARQATKPAAKAAAEKPAKAPAKKAAAKAADGGTGEGTAGAARQATKRAR